MIFCSRHDDMFDSLYLYRHKILTEKIVMFKKIHSSKKSLDELIIRLSQPNLPIMLLYGMLNWVLFRKMEKNNKILVNDYDK